MGTNFYLEGHGHSDDPKWHIGKRSAAGWYCWDCGVTLCKGGEKKIHYSWPEWYEQCPKCGAKKQNESISDGSVGRELGFNKEPYQKKTGVASCSSFSWARKLGRVQKIENEYGDKFTRKEFEEMLEECPVQYYDSMGQWFS
jgi:hypothetical protein